MKDLIYGAIAIILLSAILMPEETGKKLNEFYLAVIGETK